MSYGPGDSPHVAAPTAEALEAQRLDRTRPKAMHESKRYARWALSNPRRPKETDTGYIDRYMATLPRGTTRVVCNIVCVPTGRKAAKGRKPYHATRVVDRRVWAKLDDAARGRWIDTIRREIGA
jgi:hypothetical protein